MENEQIVWAHYCHMARIIRVSYAKDGGSS